MLHPRSSSRRNQRGFSLIELIVVVIIISVLAALAIPSITARMRDRRTQQAAGEVMNLYRSARMRAMGRGSAVLVSYSTTPNAAGRLELREAVRGGTDNCAELPVTGCQITNWANGATTNKLISEFDPGVRAEYSGVEIDVGLEGTPVDQMEICFTPMGRAFMRTGGAPFQPLTQIPIATVQRVGADNKAIGLVRQVLILPNGHARLGASRLDP